MATETGIAKPRNRERFNRRRDLIIAKATEAFGRKAFHATSLDEIAGELGVTKASLYYYFSAKEELLYAVLLTSIREHLDRADRVLEENPEASPAKKLELLIVEHLRLLATKYEHGFLLQQEYELAEPQRSMIVDLRKEYQERFSRVLHEGVEGHSFRVKDEGVAVLMILGSINWFLRWYRANGRFNVDEIARTYVDMILHGLLSEDLVIRGSLNAARPGALRPETDRASASVPRGRSGGSFGSKGESYA